MEMSDMEHKILVWLPSPMGDAILSTPALRAIRSHFKNSKITFYGNKVVHKILSPGKFNDAWLQQHNKNIFKTSAVLKQQHFSLAILFKNSFASALDCFLARIPARIGYAREARSLFLTEKIIPPRLPDGKFKPASMLDYYLTIAHCLGCQTKDRSLELLIDPQDIIAIKDKFPFLNSKSGPVVIIVPGGAFGPSKCWPSERFAQTIDRLVSKYKATAIISVSQSAAEKRIASEICAAGKNKPVNLSDSPLTIGQLKELFSLADLVITNDTGPRHIAIAFKRNIITLFGPNDPAWTESDWQNEIKIVGKAPCAPCMKPVCKEKQHYCMEDITVDAVCNAADKFLTQAQTL